MLMLFGSFPIFDNLVSETVGCRLKRTKIWTSIISTNRKSYPRNCDNRKSYLRNSDNRKSYLRKCDNRKSYLRKCDNRKLYLRNCDNRPGIFKSRMFNDNIQRHSYLKPLSQQGVKLRHVLWLNTDNTDRSHSWGASCIRPDHA